MNIRIRRSVLGAIAAVAVAATSLLTSTSTATATSVDTPAPAPEIAQATRAGTAPRPAGTLSGHFDWTSDFKCCLNSRTWTQGSGDTTISSYGDCQGDPGLTSYTITLYKDQAIDKKYATVSYECFRTQQYTWKALPAGKFYFRTAKRDNGQTISTWGDTYYP